MYLVAMTACWWKDLKVVTTGQKTSEKGKGSLHQYFSCDVCACVCRFFCLTSSGLTYSKSKSDSVLCNILTEDMLAVERVDEDAFTMKHVGVMKWVWLTLITALIPNYCPIRAGIVCRNSEVDKVNKHIYNMHTHCFSNLPSHNEWGDIQWNIKGALFGYAIYLSKLHYIVTTTV